MKKTCLKINTLALKLLILVIILYCIQNLTLFLILNLAARTLPTPLLPLEKYMSPIAGLCIQQTTISAQEIAVNA